MPRLLPAGFVTPCQPSFARTPPAGPEWLHEIKHDGFRLMVWRDGARVRLFTRNGHDWAERYPAIAAPAAALQALSFLIDGEAVIADSRGVASFNLLRRRARDGRAFVWAFDLLELDGHDLRKEPLMHRKTTLASLLRRSRDGIKLVEHIEAEDGATVFEHACKLGLEGIVSKRRDAPYRHGRSREWLKIKISKSRKRRIFSGRATLALCPLTTTSRCTTRGAGRRCGCA